MDDKQDDDRVPVSFNNTNPPTDRPVRDESFKRPEASVPQPTPVSAPDVTPQENPTAPVLTSKRSRTGKFVLVGLTVLLVAGLAAFSFWQWTEAKNSEQELVSVQQELANSLADKSSETKDTEKKTQPAPVVTTSAADQVGQAAKAYTALQLNKQYDTVKKENVTFDSSNQFAKVVVSAGTVTQGGYTVVLKKATDRWVVLDGGVTLTVEQKNALVKDFGVPEQLVK